MIGSKRRVERLLRALAEEGFDPEVLDRIHAPIGLKINAQTPAEIAVSICGEMIAHRRQYIRKDSRICLDRLPVFFRLSAKPWELPAFFQTFQTLESLPR